MANLAQERKERRKSGGPRTRWDKEGVTDELRATFMREIENSAPEVLIELRDKVWPLYRKVAHPSLVGAYIRPCDWPEGLRAAVLEFGRRHNLVYSGRVPDWVVEQFAFTLGFWTAHPEVTDDKKLKWWLRGGYSGMRRVEPLVVELRVQVERSIYETDAEFATRLTGALEKIVRPRLKTLRRRIAKMPVVPLKRRIEHYRWVVLHQIRHWSFERIANQFHVAPESVKNEVAELKGPIGLNLPPGRPRKRIL